MKILQNLKLECDIRDNESVAFGGFNQKTNKIISNQYFSAEKDNVEEIIYLETKLIEPQHLPYSEKQKIKLSEIKDQIKSQYNQMLYNMTYQPMPELEEYLPHFQVGISKRTIYPKYKKHLENLLKLNDLLDEFSIGLPRGSIDVSSPHVKQPVEPQKPIIITKNINGVNVSMQFKEKEKEKNEEEKEKEKEKENQNSNLLKDSIKNNEFRFKSLMKSHTNICLMTTKESDFASKSFEQIANYRYDPSRNSKPRIPPPRTKQFSDAENNSNYNSNPNAYAYTNNNNFNDETQKYSNKNDIADITDNVSNNIPDIKNIVRNPNKNIKVMFPKEIHTSYQFTKHGTKTIEINKDSN